MNDNDWSENTNVMVYFAILSDEIIQWEEINDMLQMQPRKAWLKGESIPRTKDRIYSFSKWEFGNDYSDSKDIRDQLTPLLDILEPKKDILKQMKKKYPLDYILEIVIKMLNGRTPIIFFDRRCNAFVDFIEAEIDIDTYVYPFTDDM